jgi:DHA1 family inner membrane transport protein
LKKYSASQELLYILILAVVQFVHILDFVVMMPLGPTLMTDFSITPVEFASLVSSYSFSAAVASLIFGAFADRFDRKKLLLFFITGFSLGTLTCFFATDFTLLLAARAVAGAFGGVLNSVVYAIVTDIVPSHRRGRAMGIVMSSFSVSSVVGIPIGLMIADYYGWQYCFLFIAVIGFLCLALSAQVIPSIKDHLEKTPEDNFWQKAVTVLSRRDYLRAFVFMFLASGSTFILIPFLSPYAVKNMGIATLDLKYMYLCGGLLTILSARAFGVLTDKIGAYRLYLITMSGAFVPIFLFTHAGVTPFWQYILLGCFFMSFVSGRMIPCMTLLSQVPKDTDRGMFMSLLNSIRSLGSGMMTFLAGFIITENIDGSLHGFDHAGYISIVIGIVTVLIAKKISQRINYSL